MALTGIYRTSKVSQTFNLFKCFINVLPKTDNKYVNLTTSRYVLCGKSLSTKNLFERQQHPKNNKSIASPKISLILSENEIISTTLEQAVKLADRRNLKLVKMLDFDIKTEKALFKLMTAAEFFAENSKVKKKNKNIRETSIKQAKFFNVSIKITEHDLQTKINQAFKLLKKRHEVIIAISKEGNHEKAQELAEAINGNLKELADQVIKTSKSSIKLTFTPRIQIPSEMNKENEAEKNEKHDKAEETI